MTDEQAVTSTPERINYTATIGGILLALLFPFAMVYAIAPWHLNLASRLMINPCVFWGEVLLLAGYARLVERRPLLIWKNREFDILFFAGWVVLLYLICYGANIIAAIPRLFGVHENRDLINRVSAAFKNHAVLLVVTAFTAGFTEEIIFRGYILTRLSLMCKHKYVPLFISAAIFAAVHLNYKSVSEVIFTFLIGLTLGYYYLKYRDIRVIIAVHFLIDLVGFLIGQHYAK